VAFPSVGAYDGVRGKRGRICGFSGGSRRRLQRRQAEVSVAAALPLFITLTYPDSILPDAWGCGEFNQFCERARSDLDAFLKRLCRELPMVSAFWRIEAQPRKSGLHVGLLVPHFHLLMYGIPSEVVGVREEFEVCDGLQLPGELVEVLGYQWPSTAASCQCFWELTCARHNIIGDEREKILASHVRRDSTVVFQDWLSTSWYHVVGSHELKHLLAGTSVACPRSLRGVACYVSKKYMAKESEVENGIYGRNWGIHNRKCIPWAKMVSIELTGTVGYRIRRIMRRYLERSRGRRYIVRNGCGMTLFCDSQRWFEALCHSPPDDPF
jgi:hypothetical protein